MDGKQMRLPSVEQIEAELKKETQRREHNRIIRTMLFVLLLVTAVAVIVTVLMFPVLEIRGGTMGRTLENGNLVIATKATRYNRGDIIVFYYNNTLLVKRVIGVAGDEVRIEEDGTVFVNGKLVREDYVIDKTLGECNVVFPHRVPKDEYFVLGDNRAVSVDSRNTALGAVTQDLIVGKILFRVWPLTAIGKVS